MPFQIIINIIVHASIYLLIGYSFSLIYSTSKFFNLAHAGILTLAPYMLYLFYKSLALELIPAILISLVIIAVVALLINKYFFVRLENGNSNALVLLILSLGVYIIIESLISVFFGAGQKIISNAGMSSSYELLNGYITTINIYTVVISIFLFALGSVVMVFSRTGLKTRSIISNESLANVFGIDIKRINNVCFVIGSVIVGICGMLVAFDTGMKPTMGFNLLLYGVVAMIIGGIGSTWGLIGGSLLLAMAQNLIAYYLSSQWMNGITYIILILFLIWKPLGFSGKRLKKVEI